jgi:hypothetical protein
VEVVSIWFKHGGQLGINMRIWMPDKANGSRSMWSYMSSIKQRSHASGSVGVMMKRGREASGLRLTGHFKAGWMSGSTLSAQYSNRSRVNSGGVDERIRCRPRLQPTAKHGRVSIQKRSGPE